MPFRRKRELADNEYNGWRLLAALLPGARTKKSLANEFAAEFGTLTEVFSMIAKLEKLKLVEVNLKESTVELTDKARAAIEEREKRKPTQQYRP